MFNREQRHRIDFEEAIVSLELSGFQKFTLPSSFGFTGWITPAAGSSSYELRLDASGEYPFEKPNLCVVLPETLWMRGGRKTINSLGATHDYHTLANGPRGIVQICHTLGWDPSFSCAQVLLKGIIWLEAYSMHLCTGATIAEIIDSFDLYYTAWTHPLLRWEAG